MAVLLFFLRTFFAASSSRRRGAEPLYQNCRATVGCSSSSDETGSLRKPPGRQERKEKKKVPGPRPAAQEMESQYETGYTTGETGNELERDDANCLYRWDHQLPRWFRCNLSGFYFITGNWEIFSSSSRENKHQQSPFLLMASSLLRCEKVRADRLE